MVKTKDSSSNRPTSVRRPEDPEHFNSHALNTTMDTAVTRWPNSNMAAADRDREIVRFLGRRVHELVPHGRDSRVNAPRRTSLAFVFVIFLCSA